MAEIIKPDMTALWASGGAVVSPTNNKINEGWTAEIPPHQWENFVQLRQDEAIAYLFQRGIAEWDNTTEYFANKSLVLYNSSLYIAIVNNQNTLPTNTTRWKPITGNATTSTAGLMSPADKLKLNGIEAGAQKNTVISVAGKVGNVTLSVGDITGALNRSNNLSDLPNIATARNNLGLGTAARRDVGTDSGNLMEVGAFGLGSNFPPTAGVGVSILDSTLHGFYRSGSSQEGAPDNHTGAGYISFGWNGNSWRTILYGSPYTDSLWFHNTENGVHKGWNEIYHTGNFNPNSKANTHNPTFTGTVSGITKGMVGLGNVNNTSDLNKPISTATQNALNAITSTRIIAGTGLTGGGTLAANRTLSVNYGTTAGTAAQGNDSRITGAAQKSANLSDLSNVGTARSNLGLGTAATRNVGTGNGNVMEVGAFGLGKLDSDLVTWNTTDVYNLRTGIYRWLSGDNKPSTYGSLVQVRMQSDRTAQISIDSEHPIIAFSSIVLGNIKYSVKALHTGNILSSTGQSTEYPMTQKAVTDALNTKANTSTQVLAGTGLSGGGNLSANRTISIANSHIPIGVGQTWQDVTGSRASGVTYTNSSQRPIAFTISGGTNHSGIGIKSVRVNGNIVARGTTSSQSVATTFHQQTGLIIVPPGSTYSADFEFSSNTLWSELQ